MAGHHEESRRTDPGRSQAESKKSVNQAASGKSKSDVDDEWGFEPKKGGMAIEAKMGMCIVVILISAFGFLVYRKFDARQRSLLQANLQAAETALPGSTGGVEGDLYAEFQPDDQILTGKPATGAHATFGGSSATDVVSPEQDVDTTFGSSFTLRETATLSPPDHSTLESTTEDSVADNSFDNSLKNSEFNGNGFASLDEPQFSAAGEDAKVPEESTKVAFAGEAAGNPLAGQVSSPMDDYLAERQSRTTDQTPVESEPETSLNDTAFPSFGDPELSAEAAAPSGHATTDSLNDVRVADASPFDALMDPEPSPVPAAETPSPTFEGFPSGFDSQPETWASSSSPSASTDNGGLASTDVAKTDEQPWPDFGQDAASEKELTFDSLSAAELPSETVDAQTDEWAPVKPSPKQPSPAFADLDSFDAEDKGSTSQPSDALELAESNSPFQKRDDANVSFGQLLASTDEPTSSGPAFESFGADNGFEFSASDSASIRVLQPASDPDASPRSANSPPGFDETFATSSEMDDDNLTSAADSFAGTQQDPNTRRGPLVDPSLLMDPSIGADGTKLISKTDHSSYSDDRSNDSVPMPVESELADSFSGYADSTSRAVDRSLQGAEQLRMPSLAPVSPPVVAKPNSGTILQVSATRDPDGIYTVKDDDTYWTISKHAYGTARFFSSLALYNKNRIKDPRRLRPGMKVVIPDPQVLIERYPELLKDYIPKESKPSGYFLKANGMPAYRIGERETLSEISQKHLGRASRWIQLYRMNQNVLQNPNRLKPGTVIDLPDDATNVHVVP